MMHPIKEYFQGITRLLNAQDLEKWTRAGDILLEAYTRGIRVWIAGNGGNLANSFHFATDWSKGLRVETGKPLLAASLSENFSTASAFANDLGFENQLANQIEMMAAPGDLVILLSAGGTSKNIINAAKISRKIDLYIIGLTGGEGQTISNLFDLHIHIDSNDIQLVEDVHAIFGHSMFKFLLDKIKLL